MRETITRNQFETMTADLLQRTADTTELVLEQAEITPDLLDAIVLVGGSTLMPQIPRRLEELLGKTPYDGLSPHTAVAQGAAIHAAILEAKYRGEGSELGEKLKKMLAAIQQQNVNSHGLGIVAANPKNGREINYVMIPRNSTLPTERTQKFKTQRDGQSRVSVQVVEGDAPDPAACSLLGKCRICDLPSELPKGSLIEVTYAFDTSGRIAVRAKDQTSGTCATIKIQRRGGLSEQQVGAFQKLANYYRVD